MFCKSDSACIPITKYHEFLFLGFLIMVLEAKIGRQTLVGGVSGSNGLCQAAPTTRPVKQS